MGALALGLVAAITLWFVVGNRRARERHVGEPVAELPVAPPPAVLPSYPRPRPTRPPRPPAVPDGTLVQFAIPPTAPSIGPANALVTLVEISDMQCPFCSRVQPVIQRLREEYGDRLRVVWIDYPLPFHTWAMPAAELGREVQRVRGDRAFWRYLDLVWTSQRTLSREGLEPIAVDVGLPLARAQYVLEAHPHEGTIRDQMRAVTAVLHGAGTPSFLVNGRLLRGAKPYEQFRDAIEAALDERGR